MSSSREPGYLEASIDGGEAGTTIVIHLPNVRPAASSPPPATDGEAEEHAWLMSPSRLLTIAEAEGFLSIGRTKLSELLASGELASVHIGAARRIPLGVLEDYVERLIGRS